MPATREQILYGLRQAIVDATGNDDPSSEETNLVDWMMADGSWQEIDLADLFPRIERPFGIRIPISEWKRLFGEGVTPEQWDAEIRPNLTFGRIADFIAEYVTPVSFAPVVIGNRPCGPAGAFLGAQELAKSIVSNVDRFGPSTLIRDRLRGDDLDLFWTALGWHTAGKVEPLRYPLAPMGCILALLGFCAAIVSFCSFCTAEFSRFILTAITSAVLFWFARLLSRIGNPLPAGIHTFRDLAERVAAR